jgi:hypothetical protein
MPLPATPSRLERVVVFENGALVTRHVDVPAGVARLAVDGLPLRLVDDALRVRPASPGLRVGLVEERCLVQVTSTSAPDTAAALLEARLRLQGIAQRRQTLRALRALDSVDVELPPGEVPTTLSTLPLLEALAGATDRAARLAGLERGLDVEEDEARRALHELERQGQVDDVPPRVLRGIELEVDVGDSGGRLEIEYFVGAARWVPSYALHLQRVDRQTRARLILGALVAQATGEDWDDVALAVSTAPLARASTLPTVHSWRLGRAQPAKPKGYRPLPSDLPSLFSGWEKFPPAVATSTPLARPKKAPPPPPPPMSMPMPVQAPMAELAMAPPPMAMPAPSMARMAAPAAPARARGGPESAKRRSIAREEAEAFALAEDADDGAPMMSGFADALGGAPGGGEGGGGFGGRASVVDELPPSLRTTGMRMAFADEVGRRGLLWPMDLRERLAWLLDVADLDEGTAEERRGEVQRALDALEDAERRLRQRPLPPGTSPVRGARARVFGGVGRASIASDGFEHRVEVHREEGPATILHHAVPREALDVWRVCRFTPSGALPPGPVQVYEHDAFVVAGTVSGSAGAAMTFNLGVDPDVRVEARTPHVHQAEKGLMGGTSVVEHRVVTEVRSTRAEPVKLSIFDRLPVPMDEPTGKDLQVALVSSTPPLERTGRGPDGEPLDGGVSVTVTLMPGDAMKLEHSYTLTLPAKLDVVGGTRRE